MEPRIDYRLCFARNTLLSFLRFGLQLHSYLFKNNRSFAGLAFIPSQVNLKGTFPGPVDHQLSSGKIDYRCGQHKLSGHYKKRPLQRLPGLVFSFCFYSFFPGIIILLLTRKGRFLFPWIHNSDKFIQMKRMKAKCSKHSLLSDKP